MAESYDTRFLGIDYGTKKIGLALSDESGHFAFPLLIINLVSSQDARLEIKRICEENNISKIVLGRPEGYKGDAKEILSKIDEFKKELETQTGLDVDFVSEVLTTRQAKRQFEFNLPRGDVQKKIKKISKEVDASAAALILQSYLDRLRA